MDITKYKTVGEWFEDVKLQGYSAPVSMCHGIQVAMKELDLSLPDVYRLFLSNGIVTLVGRTYVYDLRGHKALEDKRRKGENIKIPKGLSRCIKCGEYKGKVRERDLPSPYPEIGYETKNGMGYFKVKCLCEGPLCPQCKEHRIWRPISNFYDPMDGKVWHNPYFSRAGCKKCKS